MTATGKSALLLGATGATGQYLLKALLASPYWTRVGDYGRRVTDLKSLGGLGTQKLEQKTIDFENLGQSGLKDGKWDVVFVVLERTTKKIAGSLGYVINAAREAKSPDLEQRLIFYLSVMGTSSGSPLLYLRYEQETIVFRPALLVGTKRPEFRLAESIASWITGPLLYISDWMQIKVPPLAKAIGLVGQLGVEGLPPSAAAFKSGPAEAQYTVIPNPGCLALAEL
ncbi:hypothetical protein C8J56DRAFT_1011918 [Mycena floridula]|nr:hypothetical protein C8J56DRAFT_1011918 [Mycena floridula]